MFRRRTDAPARCPARPETTQPGPAVTPASPSPPKPAGTRAPTGRPAGGPFSEVVRDFMRGVADDWVQRYGSGAFEVAPVDRPEQDLRAGQPVIYRCRATTRLDLPGREIEPGDHLIYLARTGGEPVVGQVVVFESGDHVADGKPRMSFGRIMAATDGVLQIEAFSPDENEVTPMLFDETVLR